MFFVTAFNPDSFLGLDYLVPYGALSTAGKPYHLHGNGASAAHHMTAAHVVTQRPHYGPGIHPWMPVEVPVFKLGKSFGKALRDGLLRLREAPLTVSGNARSQELPLSTLHHSGVLHSPEKPHGNHEKPEK